MAACPSASWIMHLRSQDMPDECPECHGEYQTEDGVLLVPANQAPFCTAACEQKQLDRQKIADEAMAAVVLSA